MRVAQLILSQILCLQMVIWPLTSLAQKKPTKAELTQKLDLVRNLAFTYIANQFMAIDNVTDYEFLLVGQLRPEDRKEAVSAAHKLKTLPTARHVGDTLIFEYKNQTFRVTWPDVNTTTIEFNGVPLAYDVKRPLKGQFQDLTKRLAAARKNALFSSFFPEVHANPLLPIFYFIGVTIGAAVVNQVGGELIVNTKCWLTSGSQIDSPQCIDLRRARIEATQKDMPTFDAVINQTGSDKRNVLARWEAIDRICPSNNDGKERTYRGEFRTVNLKDGSKTPSSNWYHVVAKFTPAGAPTDLVITTQSIELNQVPSTMSAEVASKLVTHIAFDPTTQRPVSFRVPNPRRQNSSQILSSPTLNLTLNMDLTAEQKDIIANAADVVKFAIYRVYNCVAQDIVAEQQAGIEAGSPAAPKPAAPSTQ